MIVDLQPTECRSIKQNLLNITLSNHTRLQSTRRSNHTRLKLPHGAHFKHSSVPKFYANWSA